MMKLILLSIFLLFASIAQAQYYPYPSTGGGDVHWKAPVTNAAALPLISNSAGDARFTLDTLSEFVWNGASWTSPTNVISTTLASTKIIVGNSSNVATAVSMSGDATISNVGLVTVVTVGTSTAANIHAAELLANAATATNTINTILKRDGSGQVAATTFSGALAGNAATATALAAIPTACASNTFSNAIAANGNLSCTSIPNAATTAASTNTASAIVTRDASGNFTANVITAVTSFVGDLTGTVTGHSSLDLPLTGGTMTGAIVAPAGLVATPSIAETGSLGTGIYFPAADTFGLAIAGSDLMRANATGMSIGTNTISAMMRVKNVTGGDATGFVLESDTGKSWSFAAEDKILYILPVSGNPIIQFCANPICGGWTSFGANATTPVWQWDFTVSDSGTTPITVNVPNNATHNVPMVVIRNTDIGTVGNYSGLGFADGGATGAVNSFISGVNKVHTAGASSGEMQFYTRNAGTAAQFLTGFLDQTVALPKYGMGVAHLSAAGLITSSNIVNADVSASAAIDGSKLGPITGYVSGAGTVSATDTVVQAISKLNGNAAGGGGGGTNAKFELEDAIVPYIHFGQHTQIATQSLTVVNVGIFNSGTSGSTTVTLNQYRSGAFLNSATVSIASSSGNPATSVNAALSGTLSLLSGDLVTADLTTAAGGSPSGITLEY